MQEVQPVFTEWEKHTRCCLCGSSQIIFRFPHDIWSCHDCSVFFRNPRPSQKQIIRSYDTGTNYEYWQDELGVREMLWRKRMDIVLRYKRSGHLLDVGTGDGHFLDFANEFFETEANEVSTVGAEYARRRGHDPVVGDLMEVSSLGRLYDVITLWHVLEHLPAPGRTLRNLKQLLKPDGILIIAVPNESSILMQKCLMRQKKIDDFSRLNWGGEIHLTHFTMGVLTEFLSNIGFSVLEAGVDDVHVKRTATALLGYYGNVLLNALFKLHFDRAMYLVCKISGVR